VHRGGQIAPSELREGAGKRDFRGHLRASLPIQDGRSDLSTSRRSIRLVVWERPAPPWRRWPWRGRGDPRAAGGASGRGYYRMICHQAWVSSPTFRSDIEQDWRPLEFQFFLCHRKNSGNDVLGRSPVPSLKNATEHCIRLIPLAPL
jgi:hypothetical protein